MREKLIKLIASGRIKCFDTECYNCEYGDGNPNCLNQLIADHLIENGVVIPVRCGECKHRDEDGDICYYHSSFGDDKICYTYPDGYCSYGKPKESEEE
jgi:hypothetical protein